MPEIEDWMYIGVWWSKRDTIWENPTNNFKKLNFLKIALMFQVLKLRQFL